VGEARSAYLGSLAEGLTPAEVDQLRPLLAKVMAAVVLAKDGGAWTCRLCDLAACRRDQGECPALTAAVTARH
jgi:hypothetical protein